MDLFWMGLSSTQKIILLVLNLGKGIYSSVAVWGEDYKLYYLMIKCDQGRSSISYSGYSEYFEIFLPFLEMNVRMAPALFENEAAILIFLDVEVKLLKTTVSFYWKSFSPKYSFRLVFVIPR